MNSALIKVANALTSIEDLRVYHYWRYSAEVPYCIWAEDGESSSLSANNRKGEQAISGSVDYFTLAEFDPHVDDIQKALNDVEGLGWRLNSVQYEEETNLIHYEWRFSAIGNMEF